MYHLFLIMEREVRSVKPFGFVEFAGPSPRRTYRLPPAGATLDFAPVRLGSFLASVKSYQAVPSRGRLRCRTSDCAAR